MFSHLPFSQSLHIVIFLDTFLTVFAGTCHMSPNVTRFFYHQTFVTAIFSPMICNMSRHGNIVTFRSLKAPVHGEELMLLRTAVTQCHQILPPPTTRHLSPPYSQHMISSTNCHNLSKPFCNCHHDGGNTSDYQRFIEHGAHYDTEQE